MLPQTELGQYFLIMKKIKGDVIMSKLFVDDTRKFPQGFECCRDYDDAITLLSLFKFEYISLDY